MTDLLRLVLYGMTSLALGFAVIVVPSAGFLFRDPALYGITDAQYGLFFLPMVTVTIVTGFGYQAIVSRLGRRLTFLAGYFWTALYLILVLTASFASRAEMVFWLLMFAQASLGFGFALLTSSVSVFAIELFPHHRTSVLTAIHAMFGVGALLSPLALDLWHRMGFWQGQVGVGILEVVVVGVAAMLSRSIPVDATGPSYISSSSAPDHPNDSGNPFRIFVDLPIRAKGFIAALVLYGTLEALVANWSTIYLTRERGFGATTAAVCLSLFWGFLALGRVLSTFATLRIEPRLLFRAAPFVMIVGLLLLKSVRVESAIFLPYMVIGLGCSCTFPVSVGLTTRYHDSLRQVLPSFMLAGLMTGVGTGSTAIGFFRGMGLFTLEQAFAGALVTAVALCVIFFFLTTKA